MTLKYNYTLNKTLFTVVITKAQNQQSQVHQTQRPSKQSPALSLIIHSSTPTL